MQKSFAFTGIPGTSIQRVVDHLSASMRANTIAICIDEYLWKAFAADARQNVELLRQTELDEVDVQEGCRPNWWRLLTMPIGAIRHYWQVGAKRALDEMKSNTEADIVFVIFHACYQSDHYRWRLSAVDPSILSEFGFHAFITLIDDVYDVHRRRADDLAAERMAVGYNEGDNIERAQKLIELSVSYLDHFLFWRQEEIVLTDLFAAACGVPSHVFAIKHPTRTLAKLIEDPGVSTYFSHPITAIRTQSDFDRTDDFSEINQISSVLREKTTLIEPTTIDEYRIVTDRTGGINRYVPKLSPRWPLLQKPSDLAFAPLNVYSDPLEEYVFSKTNAAALGLERECESICNGEGPKSVLDLISLTMQRLSERIAEDITWRDHYLVDQTKSLVVYRPLQKGRLSLGVKRELEYYARLCLTGAAPRGCIIYHPDEDRRLRSMEVAKELVTTWREHSDIGPHLQPSLAHINATELLSMLENAIFDTTDSISGGVQCVNVLERFVKVEPQIASSTPMSSGTTYAAIQRADRVRQLASDAAASVIQREYYVDMLKNAPGLNFIFVQEQDRMLDSLDDLKPKQEEKSNVTV
ncbi:MAG: hypothetical protein QOH71_3574 [Blastocatellia bacterium]|jgi:hypothetical protein|nr:hypothetical protein [Blastocatellia bacterium]